MGVFPFSAAENLRVGAMETMAARKKEDEEREDTMGRLFGWPYV
jgi:hypothetical protein